MIQESLEKLLQYEGRGQKPHDFDAFWDKELSKLENLSLDYQLEQAAVASNVADCYILTFTSFDGTRISCQLLKPKRKGATFPGLLQFHGYHVNSGDFS